MTKEEYIEINNALSIIVKRMDITEEFGDMVEDFYLSTEVKEDLSKFTPEEVVKEIVTDEYAICCKIFGIDDCTDDDRFFELKNDDELIQYIKENKKY